MIASRPTATDSFGAMSAESDAFTGAGNHSRRSDPALTLVKSSGAKMVQLMQKMLLVLAACVLSVSASAQDDDSWCADVVVDSSMVGWIQSANAALVAFTEAYEQRDQAQVPRARALAADAHVLIDRYYVRAFPNPRLGAGKNGCVYLLRSGMMRLHDEFAPVMLTRDPSRWEAGLRGILHILPLYRTDLDHLTR